LQVDAVVLTGGKLKGEKTQKGFLKIGGMYMAERVIRALKDSPSIRQLLAVIPFRETGEWEKKLGVRVCFSDGDLLTNLKAGLDAFKESEMVLITSGDIPLLTSEAVEDFLSRCSLVPADGYYPIISKRWVEKKFPQTKRTYATLREGTFTGGNFILIRPEVILSNWSWAKKLYEGRKSPLQQANLLGFSVIFGFLTKTLTIRKAEKRLSLLLKADLKAVITPYPEIGTDVDKKEDYELVLKLLGGEAV
jgi:GTP:adenosylcobinamide-phosphate guanylyltransferase